MDTYPTLTYEELETIAKRGGVVRWYPSRFVEVLRYSPNKKLIFARPLSLEDTKEHVIHRIRGRDHYRCEDVTNKSIPAGELLGADLMGRMKSRQRYRQLAGKTLAAHNFIKEVGVDAVVVALADLGYLERDGTFRGDIDWVFNGP